MKPDKKFYPIRVKLVAEFPSYEENKITIPIRISKKKLYNTNKAGDFKADGWRKYNSD